MKTNPPRIPARRVDGVYWNSLVSRRPGRLTLGAKPGSRADDGTTSIVQSHGGPWTIAEYDPATGEIIQRWDRGRPRDAQSLSTGAVGDVGLLHHVDDDDNAWLYAAGYGVVTPTRESPIVKWDPDAADPADARVWNSDQGAHSGPLHQNLFSGRGAGNAGTICRASDGAIWIVGTDTINFCVGRYDPATGAQTHKLGSLSNIDAILALPSDGKVLLVRSNRLDVLDDTATIVATLMVSSYGFDVGASRIFVTQSSSGTIKAYDFSLTEQDTATIADFQWGPCYAQGGTVYVLGFDVLPFTQKLYALDATDLSTQLWASDEITDGLAVNSVLERAGDAVFVFGDQYVTKLDIADGSAIWVKGPSAGNVGPRPCHAVGSDFVITTSAGGGAGRGMLCLNDSDGSVRWFESYPFAGYQSSVVVTPDDRVFICGPRFGP
jgi:hypothetical protein